MRYLLFILSLIFLPACDSSPIIEQYRAETQLSESQKNEFLSSIIRYLGRLAAKADHETKFSAEFNEHYASLVKEHSLEYYRLNPQNGEVQFLATRVAPSLYHKKVAIAGKVAFSNQGDIIYYEEIFRTWKMPEDELTEKSKLLFSEFIHGADLTAYYRENSGDEEYIEFPNKNSWFDVDQRRWRHSLFGETDVISNY